MAVGRATASSLRRRELTVADNCSLWDLALSEHFDSKGHAVQLKAIQIVPRVGMPASAYSPTKSSHEVKMSRWPPAQPPACLVLCCSPFAAGSPVTLWIRNWWLAPQFDREHAAWFGMLAANRRGHVVKWEHVRSPCLGQHHQALLPGAGVCWLFHKQVATYLTYVHRMASTQGTLAVDKFLSCSLLKLPIAGLSMLRQPLS